MIMIRPILPKNWSMTRTEQDYETSERDKARKDWQ